MYNPLNVSARVEWAGNLCALDCSVDAGQRKDSADNATKTLAGNETCLNNTVRHML